MIFEYEVELQTQCAPRPGVSLLVSGRKESFGLRVDHHHSPPVCVRKGLNKRIRGIGICATSEAILKPLELRLTRICMLTANVVS